MRLREGGPPPLFFRIDDFWMKVSWIENIFKMLWLKFTPNKGKGDLSKIAWVQEKSEHPLAHQPTPFDSPYKNRKKQFYVTLPCIEIAVTIIDQQNSENLLKGRIVHPLLWFC